MTTNNEYLSSNVAEIRQRVASAAERSGRGIDDITVIAVSKTIDCGRINSVVSEGFKNLGENRVQELLEKYDNIKDGCKWHLIGHLQTNKVKYIIDKVSLIHSVDRLELAKEIQNKALKISRVMDILVQVNVSGEESKFGISPDKTLELIKEISKFPNVKVRGLMTIAPFTDDMELVRLVFRGLKKIFIDIKQENIDNVSMDYLSMGMSNDFEAAIEEGANMVRIGTAIFGQRPKVKGYGPVES